MENKFNIGDRVVSLRDNLEGNSLIMAGDCGTVCQVLGNLTVGVAWDHPVRGHDCSGTCEYGFGWRVPACYVSRLEEEADFEIEEDAYMGILKSV